MNYRSVAIVLAFVLFFILAAVITLGNFPPGKIPAQLAFALKVPSPSPTRVPPTSTSTATPVPTPTATPTLTPSPSPTPTPVVLIGAGDISRCESDGGNHTAVLIEKLLRKYPQAAVFTAGDNAQSMGETYEYEQCFNLTWGRFKDRIHPSPGNHDWATDAGGPYFDYFGSAAGKPGLGYYSYNLGSWHLVSLNSNCEEDGCGDDSAQAQWLRKDLKNSKSSCTLLYWHHPIRSSGDHGNVDTGKTFWKIASTYKAEIVVNGHDHFYERFTPLNGKNKFDKINGIRAFTVGTGGSGLFRINEPLPVSEVRSNETYGVIVFFLYPDHYEWEFVPTDLHGFTDAGSGSCH